jgi:chitosanase
MASRVHRQRRSKSTRRKVIGGASALAAAALVGTGIQAMASTTSRQAATADVSTAAQLVKALAAATPGETITLADGTYRGQFAVTKPGTAAAPITLAGGPGAILTSSGGNGYGLWLKGAPYWKLTGFTVDHAAKGVVLDASSHVTIDHLTVHDIGDEGVHFRSGSAYGVIENSFIHDTGTTAPSYGEGVYVGSANSNWDKYAGPSGVDASDHVQVLNNRIGPNVAAEGIDIKEGTNSGLVSGNTLDGTGEKDQNSGDSTIDVKGDGYSIIGNTVSHPYTDGFQVHNVYAKYGCGNTFANNTFALGGAPGYGVNVTDNGKCAVKNAVVKSNTSTGGRGLTNIPTTGTAGPAPTASPTARPSASATPSVKPTAKPSAIPSASPTHTGTAVNLTDANKKEIAMELVSSAENSSLDWKAQYKYIEDIGDGRGYTAGIIGFCSGTGDMLQLVEAYTATEPGNVLAKYIPALKKDNNSASHSGLGSAFVSAWKTAAKDTVFQTAQNNERDKVYFTPAVKQAEADGLHALGQFIYYDAMVMHGPGEDSTSFGGIRKTAMKKAKTPAQGGNETTYLNAYLDARKAAMLTEAAHDDTSRVDTEQRVFLKAGNLNLNPPLKWKTYGDSYTINS